MNDNRAAVLQNLRKLARELPLTGWVTKDRVPPTLKSPPDDDVIDRLIVEGRPLDELEGWIRRAAKRRTAKRFRNRPAGSVDMRNRLIRWLVSEYVDAGLKRADVIREVAKGAELKVGTVRGILRETR